MGFIVVMFDCYDNDWAKNKDNRRKVVLIVVSGIGKVRNAI